MRIVINKCCGGFRLSNEAVHRIVELLGSNYDAEKHFIPKGIGNWLEESYDIERNDPVLIQVVEELGTKANGPYANLHIVDIPDDLDWEIEDHMGIERIRQKAEYYG